MEIVGVAIGFSFRSKCQRLPDIDGSPKDRMLESRWHHANYLDGLSIKLNSSTHDARITSEPARPQTITEDDDVIGAWLEFFRFEHAPVCRRHSQDGKEIGGARDAEQTFRGLALFGEIAADKGVGSHL